MNDKSRHGAFSPKIYGTAILNEKGQLVIPAEARAELGFEPGTRLLIIQAPMGGGVIVVKSADVEAHIRNFSQAIMGSDTPNATN